MAAGKTLTNLVFKCLIEQLKPLYPKDIKPYVPGNSDRAIRYAINNLVKAGKVRRIGNERGPAEAIRRD